MKNKKRKVYVIKCNKNNFDDVQKKLIWEMDYDWKETKSGNLIDYPENGKEIILFTTDRGGMFYMFVDDRELYTTFDYHMKNVIDGDKFISFFYR